MRFKKGHVLPTVRIQKIVMEDFKCVSYGKVLFNCGRKVIPQDTESDILGIYGQNASGKTTVIEALAILKSTMSGKPLSTRYSDCIAVGAEFAKLSFTFDLQYPPDNRTRTVTYSFKIANIPNEKHDDFDAFEDMDHIEYENIIAPFYKSKLKVFDETISAGGFFGESSQKMQVILTSAGKNYPIGPLKKAANYVGNDKDGALVELEVNKRTASIQCTSFIFSDETMRLFYDSSGYSEYFQVLSELNYFAKYYLFVVDTTLSGLGGSQLAIPIFNRRMNQLGMKLVDEATALSEKAFEILEGVIGGINTVLPTIISGLKIELVTEKIYVGKKVAYDVKFYSNRNGTLIPFRAESAGLIRIVSVLSLIISAYNEKSITVAIDELDAGIYEYLLGELLSGLETYGKGQFIFTSHNLRPLEVLKKENIIFTTANPKNRYIRLKGVGHSNNLRRLYLKEILGSTQDEQIYDAAKRQRMIAAFMKAGVGNGEEE